jgi:pimeloyl-ACP methyl ester carboxylesterase
MPAVAEEVTPSSQVPTGGVAVHAARGLAAFFQALPPAATAAVAFLVASPIDELALPLYVTLPLVLEAVHYVMSSTSSRAFSGKTTTSLPERDATEMVDLWARCLADPTISTTDFITGWFDKAPADRAATPTDGTSITVTLVELQRENVADWLSYALFATPLVAISPEQRSHLDESISMLEARLSTEVAERGAERPFRFPPGFNKELRSYRLNIDPPAMNMKTRPLLYYALTDGLLCGLITPALMRQRGFTLHKEGGLTYWHHPGEGASQAEAAAAAACPIVFVHGVGLGPLPYHGFIDSMLREARGAPMLVLELPFVSQRLTGLTHVPHEERTSSEIAAAMERHGLASATFVGHSLGTMYLAWLARLQPHLLASCVFIDPIVFLLHQHNVAQAFLYSRPSKANFKGHVEHYFIKSEHSIVSFFHRHFYWFANILWSEELPCPTAVILSEQDGLIPVSAVEKYLTKRSKSTKAMRRVLTLPNQSHGSFLVDEAAKEAVLSTIRDAQTWGSALGEPAAALPRRAWAVISWPVAAPARRVLSWRRSRVATASAAATTTVATSSGRASCDAGSREKDHGEAAEEGHSAEGGETRGRARRWVGMRHRLETWWRAGAALDDEGSE